MCGKVVAHGAAFSMEEGIYTLCMYLGAAYYYICTVVVPWCCILW